jgi:hypothetical protein
MAGNFTLKILKFFIVSNINKKLLLEVRYMSTHHASAAPLNYGNHQPSIQSCRPRNAHAQHPNPTPPPSKNKPPTNVIAPKIKIIPSMPSSMHRQQSTLDYSPHDDCPRSNHCGEIW